MTPVPDVDAERLDYQRNLGARLRRIRHQQQLSLADVEVRSGGEWKAVVVGAYERGDRAVSLERLERLARFYGVPVTELLPSRRPPRNGTPIIRAVLDLTRLEQPETRGVAAVSRYAGRIRRLRGDHNGRVLTVRDGDLDMLALAIGVNPHNLIDDLRDRGVLIDSA